MSAHRPVVGIITNKHLLNDQYEVHGTGIINISAIGHVSDAIPLLIPVDPEAINVEELCQVCDGFLLTGGRPNVHPEEYGHQPTEAHGDFDQDLGDPKRSRFVDEDYYHYILEEPRVFVSLLRHVYGPVTMSLDLGLERTDIDEAGVRWCMAMGGRDSSNARNLPYEAAASIAHGLPEDAALRSITLSAAELLGVGDELGSLEAGKRATLFVANGDAFELSSSQACPSSSSIFGASRCGESASSVTM